VKQVKAVLDFSSRLTAFLQLFLNSDIGIMRLTRNITSYMIIYDMTRDAIIYYNNLRADYAARPDARLIFYGGRRDG
jgi:hypothetical protein